MSAFDPFRSLTWAGCEVVIRSAERQLLSPAGRGWVRGFGLDQEEVDAGSARKLRGNSTDAEKLLWSRLRSRQLGQKFVRQFPIGPYVADFACRTAHLVIELDGGQHEQAADAPRTEVIEAHGYRVIRFWNNEVIENLDGVLAAIVDELQLVR